MLTIKGKQIMMNNGIYKGLVSAQTKRYCQMRGQTYPYVI